MDGDDDGLLLGMELGSEEGLEDGKADGVPDGAADGDDDGASDGAADGELVMVGLPLGEVEGTSWGQLAASGYHNSQQSLASSKGKR